MQSFLSVTALGAILARSNGGGAAIADDTMTITNTTVHPLLDESGSIVVKI